MTVFLESPRSRATELIDSPSTLLVAQAIDRSGSRLIHDPSQDRSASGVILGRSTPNRVEGIHRQLLGRPVVAEKSRQECEDEAVRPLIKRPEDALIARAHCPNERNPHLFRYTRLGVVTIEEVAKGFLARAQPHSSWFVVMHSRCEMMPASPDRGNERPFELLEHPERAARCGACLPDGWRRMSR